MFPYDLWRGRKIPGEVHLRRPRCYWGLLGSPPGSVLDFTKFGDSVLFDWRGFLIRSCMRMQELTFFSAQCLTSKRLRNGTSIVWAVAEGVIGSDNNDGNQGLSSNGSVKSLIPKLLVFAIVVSFNQEWHSWSDWRWQIVVQVTLQMDHICQIEDHFYVK